MGQSSAGLFFLCTVYLQAFWSNTDTQSSGYCTGVEYLQSYSSCQRMWLCIQMGEWTFCPVVYLRRTTLMARTVHAVTVSPCRAYFMPCTIYIILTAGHACGCKHNNNWTYLSIDRYKLFILGILFHFTEWKALPVACSVWHRRQSKQQQSQGQVFLHRREEKSIICASFDRVIYRIQTCACWRMELISQIVILSTVTGVISCHKLSKRIVKSLFRISRY